VIDSTSQSLTDSKSREDQHHPGRCYGVVAEQPAWYGAECPSHEGHDDGNRNPNQSAKLNEYRGKDRLLVNIRVRRTLCRGIKA
jgi:hypothetical protein